MSENLDLVRSIYADWERVTSARPSGRTPRSSTCPPTDPSRAAGRGWRDGSGLRASSARWEDFRVDAEEYRELDDERVLVLDAVQRARQRRADWSSRRSTGRAEPLPHPRRQGHEAGRLLRPRPRPRRPRPGGVGDVAGERGDRRSAAMRDQRAATETTCRASLDPDVECRRRPDPRWSERAYQGSRGRRRYFHDVDGAWD